MKKLPAFPILARCAAFCAISIIQLSILFPSIALADFNVALVDINRVLNESNQAKEMRQQLDVKQAAAKKKLEERGKALKATEEKIKQGKIAEDSKEGEKFRADAKEFSRMVKDTDEDLKREFLKVNRTLTEHTLQAIEAYAKRNNIDLVLEKSEKGKSAVLFGDASYDITDAIVKSINSNG